MASHLLFLVHSMSWIANAQGVSRVANAQHNVRKIVVNLEAESKVSIRHVLLCLVKNGCRHSWWYLAVFPRRCDMFMFRQVQQQTLHSSGVCWEWLPSGFCQRQPIHISSHHELLPWGPDSHMSTRFLTDIILFVDYCDELLAYLSKQVYCSSNSRCDTSSLEPVPCCSEHHILPFVMNRHIRA